MKNQNEFLKIKKLPKEVEKLLEIPEKKLKKRFEKVLFVRGIFWSDEM